MSDWPAFLEYELQQPYMQQTLDYVAKRRVEGIAVYPPKEQVFSAFEATALNNIRVVILGQDPYHGKAKPMAYVFLCCQRLKSYRRR